MMPLDDSTTHIWARKRGEEEDRREERIGNESVNIKNRKGIRWRNLRSEMRGEKRIRVERRGGMTERYSER